MNQSLPLSSSSARPADHADTSSRGINQRHLIMVLLPVVVMLCFAVPMWHFISFAFMSNPLLNGLIAAVMAWGIYTMVRHVQGLVQEDQVFNAGMRWLRAGPAGGEQHPRLGPPAFVVGMLERLSKLGLGHQVYIHSSAMEPEIEALDDNLVKRQELSQFLVGLMVGLGLLGTFIGLLEVLVETSTLIGTIANSVGGSDMEGEFSRIVGGLQKPLAAMGTAFSASMFGLVGSIVLGFQMVAVRKAATALVDHVRTEVLSLAEKSSNEESAEISERFLAQLLADILEQHRASSAGLASVVNRLDTLMPEVASMITASKVLSERIDSQEQALERTSAVLSGVVEVVPVLSRVASASEGMLVHGVTTQASVDRVVQTLPKQEALTTAVTEALRKIDGLERGLAAATAAGHGLRDEVMQQAVLVKRMDGVLWDIEKSSLRDAFRPDGARS